jgi:putative ABC transport system permease protein
MLFNTILLALRSIRRNLMRSFLTILGIVIGVSAVITMVTLGNGATLAVQTRSPAWAPTCCKCGPASAWGRVAARRAVIQGHWMPTRSRSRSAAFWPWRRRRVQAPRWWPAAQLDHQRDRQHQRWLQTATGRFRPGPHVHGPELRAGAAVCLIGETIRRELYGGRDPVGEQLRVKAFSCEVVGVLGSKGRVRSATTRTTRC